ncbi:MAG: CopD family protein [Gemmatimonadetes bacterium]|nr:CopD family protein [Gemmatimonadota bacterium]
MTLFYLNVTVHLLAAFVWLGGLFFLVVAAPVLRSVDPPELRSELFQRLGRQMRTVGWVAIAVLFITGIVNLQFRGVLRWEVLGSAGFWAGGYGRTLAWKLAAVAMILAVSAVHDFAVGPAAGRLPPASPAAQRLRRQATWLGRLSGLIGILLIYVAVRLARGG